MAFSCTVLSTITLWKLWGLTTRADSAALIVCVSIHSRPASPMRLRQPVNELGSIGCRCWNQVSPQNNCQYGFSTQPHTTSWSDNAKVCCKYSRPAMSLGEVAGRPRDEGKCPAHSRSKTLQSMWVDSWTSGWFRLTSSSSRWRNMSALCDPAGFGPIQASEICKELASILAKACKSQLLFFYFLLTESSA